MTESGDDTILRMLLDKWGESVGRVHLEGWVNGRIQSLCNVVAELIRSVDELSEIPMPGERDVPPCGKALPTVLGRGVWQALEELETWLRAGKILTAPQQPSGMSNSRWKGLVSRRSFDADPSPEDAWEREGESPEVAQLRLPSDEVRERGATYPFFDFFRQMVLLERWRCGDPIAGRNIVTDLWQKTRDFAELIASKVLHHPGLEECGFFMAIEEVELSVLPGSNYTSANPHRPGRYRGEVSGRRALKIRTPAQWRGQREFYGLFRLILKRRIKQCWRSEHGPKSPLPLGHGDESGDVPAADYPDPGRGMEEILVDLDNARQRLKELVENIACAAEQLGGRQRGALLALIPWIKRCVANFGKDTASLSDEKLTTMRIEKLSETVLGNPGSVRDALVPKMHEFVRARLGVKPANFDQICRRLRKALPNIVGVSLDARLFLEGFAFRYKKQDK